MKLATALLSLAFLLPGCSFAPPLKYAPGERFTVSCNSKDPFGMSRCDNWAKDMCDNRPVLTDVIEQAGDATQRTALYYCP
jgi:hypothetical protein